jgi:hypothetical protein
MGWIQNTTVRVVNYVRQGMTTEEKQLFLMIMALFLIGIIFRLFSINI